MESGELNQSLPSCADRPRRELQGSNKPSENWPDHDSSRAREPAPDVEILQFTSAGQLLTVRPYCNNEHYWQVYFDTNRLIRESFTEAEFPVPEQHYAVRGGVEQIARSVISSAA